MDTLINIIEIFALVTGVPYIILEVLQKNTMWYFGIATGLACAVSFAIQHLWASMGLNIYYVFMSFWGLYQWRKDAGTLAVEDAETGDTATIHLNRMKLKTALISLLIFVVGTALLIGLLNILKDNESSMDAIVTVMSAIAMVWLGKSYPYHWLIWIVADCLLTGLCLSQGMYWMAILYGFYIISATYGLFHWFRRGRYV